MNRPICTRCKQRPRAIAYHKYNRIYYRSTCGVCQRKPKLRTPEPKWKSSGYKKKPTCDRCGFRSKYSAQLMVYHIDGNLNNNQLRNLKTVCQNCVVEIAKIELPWRPGDLEPDL